MPFEVRRGPGRPKKDAEPTHVIHEDGSYSNDLRVSEPPPKKKQTVRDRIKKNTILKFGVGPYTWSGVVHKITDRGVYCRPSLHEEVDISRCVFYNWDEIETQVAGVS